MSHNEHTVRAADKLASGLTWFGFWLMLGMSTVTYVANEGPNEVEKIKKN